MASILVIDDDEPTRDVLKAILEPAGHVVTEAPNGVDGVTRYRMNPTDLVILDIFMSEKEGIEVIRELKSEFPSIRILVVSGSGVEYMSMAKDLGAFRAIEKPFAREEILETVEALVGT